MLRSSLTVLGAFALGRVIASSPYVESMSSNAQELFTESMTYLDKYYDSKAGYLYDTDSALRHGTRSSIWYAFGLLARNEGSDAAEADKIIINTIAGQYKVESEEWYGNYKKSTEEPYVGSPQYPAKIYNSWDPNWRGFIGTTLVMAMEEFPQLLTDSTQSLILTSLHNATRGDEYRFGNLDPAKDNLYPSYSNPAIMRAFVSGWTGRRLKNCNMTRGGEKYAKEIIDLFNQHDTLSEFNSGTYTGVSLFGLILWSKYLPQDSVMTQNGPRMLAQTWKAVSQLWHPEMKNMAGPWDRAYGYDMNRYLSLMALWFWTLIGKENSSLITSPEVMSHSGDYAWGPLFAALASTHEKLIPKKVAAGLSEFQGEHTFVASANYPPFDVAPRNITTWVSKELTIGAQSFDMTVLGGPARSQTAFNPAVVQWDTGSEIAFISLYPTEMALDVKVDPRKLRLSYPYGNKSSIFTFAVGTFGERSTLASWDDVQGLEVQVNGNMVSEYLLSFNGARGGSGAPIQDFEFWNFTYTMPADFEGVPTIELNLKVI